MASKKEVATKEETLPATINFEDDAGAGFEEAGSNAFAIPFLRVLQKGSPQCDDESAEFIDGAKAGDYFNTVTEEVYAAKDGPVTVIPVLFRPIFNKWAPRGAGGGGFKGSVSEAEGLRLLQSCTKDEKNRDLLPDGDILTDTREHYVLIVNQDGTTSPALFPLVSTQIKKSKKWMTQMSGIQLPNGAMAPMFSQKYELTTVGEENDQGTWKGVKIVHAGQVTDVDQYQAAKKFLELIKAGQVETAQPTDEPF